MINADVKSYDLGVAFLGDHPELDTEENRKDLAETIQRAIEDWIEEHSP